MALQLGAKPTVVAREIGFGVQAKWDWVLDKDDVSTLRLALSDGLVGTAQRRDPNDGTWLLLAWSVPQQRHAAEAAQAERERRRPLLLRPGHTPRVYKPTCRSVGMRTHAPYAHEPAHWG